MVGGGGGRHCKGIKKTEGRYFIIRRPRRFRMRRQLSSLSGKFAYRTRFRASSGNSDSANWPGYEASVNKTLVRAIRLQDWK